MFYGPVDIRSVTNTIGESIPSISIWHIVNQLVKYDFSCGWVVNNLRERQLFFWSIEYFDLILARRYWNWNCSTITLQ